MKTWQTRSWLFVSAVIISGFLYMAFKEPLDGDSKAHKLMETRANLQGVGQSLDQWIAENKRVPTDQEWLAVLLEPPQHSIPDGWGHLLVYKAVPSRAGRQFQLYSIGPNGVDEGGDGDDIAYPFR